MSGKSSNAGNAFYPSSMHKKGGDLRAGNKVQVLLTHQQATEVPVHQIAPLTLVKDRHTIFFPLSTKARKDA